MSNVIIKFMSSSKHLAEKKFFDEFEEVAVETHDFICHRIESVDI